MKYNLGMICFVFLLGEIIYASIRRCIDLSVIGHLRKWKKIKCPKGLVTYCKQFFHKGYDVLEDCMTHPQIFILLGAHLLFFAFWFALMFLIAFHADEVDEWVLILIGVIGYSIIITEGIVLRRLAKREISNEE